DDMLDDDAPDDSSTGNDDDMDDDDTSTGNDDDMDADDDMGADDDMDDSSVADDDAPDDTSLCAKYGGADNVASVVQNQVIGAIAGDCRVNTFFTSLSEDAFTRVGECLTIQVQELFGCEGIVYAG